MSGSPREKAPDSPRRAEIKMAGRVYLRTVLAGFLNVILYMSLAMLASGLGTKTIGERVFEKGSDGSVVMVTEYTYSETTTAAASETEAADASSETESGGPTRETEASAALPSNQYTETIRSEMPGWLSAALDVVSQAMMLILLISMPYSVLWTQGDKDSNAIHFGRMKEDRLRGLRVGLMAAVPSAAAYLVLLADKAGVLPFSYFYPYKILNVSFMPIILGMTGRSVSAAADVSWARVLLLSLTLVVVPAICAAAYLLGLKNISLMEKFLYVNPNKKKRRR